MEQKDEFVLIERFLDGELKTQELEQFKRLLNNEAFARDCLLMAKMIDGIEKNQYLELKEQIRKWRL